MMTIELFDYGSRDSAEHRGEGLTEGRAFELRFERFLVQKTHRLLSPKARWHEQGGL